MNKSIWDTFTNQYSLSKTLRFELKPIGETADWIKKHDIIHVDGKELKGKDAIRANNYKYAKKLLDAMHRLFLDEALSSLTEEEKKKLTQEVQVISESGSLDDSRKALSEVYKEIYDRIAGKWIEDYCQQMPEFWRLDIADFEEKKAENPKKKKYYTNKIKKLEKFIEKPDKDFKKKDVNAMYSNTESFKLLEWKVRKEAIKITGKELLYNDSLDWMPKDSLVSIIRDFDGFHTYFSGFNENRANVYNCDKKKFISTSVIFRNFEQNVFFHLENIRKWKTILKSVEEMSEELTKKGWDWKEKLTELEADLGVQAESILQPDSYVSFLSQSGIDEYNRTLGGQATAVGKNKPQGLNEWINLTRQKAGAKRNKFPTLQSLYKQILSKKEAPFLDLYKNDEDMLDALRQFHQRLFTPDTYSCDAWISQWKNEYQEMARAAVEEQESIWISENKLNLFSKELTGNWSAIRDWLVGLNVTDGDLSKEKVFSLSVLEEVFLQKQDGKNFYEHLQEPWKSCEQNLLLYYFEKKIEEILGKIEKSWKSLNESGVLELQELDKNRDREGNAGFQQVAQIKLWLDVCNELASFLSDWKLDSKKKLNCFTDWYDFLQNSIDQFPIFDLYNQVRNYVTKKPYSSEKMKVNFEKSTLLNGWDRNMESQNFGILLERDGAYFLGVMTPDSNDLFDYEITTEDKDKKRAKKELLATKALIDKSSHGFRKINYKLLPGPNKMLPKVFFAKSNAIIFNPSKEIIEIKENKQYAKAYTDKYGLSGLHKYIEFCQQSLLKHPEWAKAFGFTEEKFSSPSSYRSVDGFYREVEEQGYKISFDNISADYIEENIKNGKLYLFQIYNKDFSKQKKAGGRDNLHTSYWKLLFSEENLRDTVLKLNGEAEIFFRQASIQYDDEKRRKGHHANELAGKFDYPILKDRRYSEDKFFFHCPISLNFKAASEPGRFNQKIIDFLRKNQEVKVIGIDRGEKHLLYYSVVDQEGNICEQGSLNTILTGKNEDYPVNYLKKLKEKEDGRDQARKSWSAVENIKDLKAGYLSHVVHQLAKLIIEHNAIVVLEDLNAGFKRGRFKVERQVYQKFERSLIEKLNYLVFKGRKSREETGHYLNAFQLTNKFESFQKLGKQSGILFYTSAAYTSTTDPVSGFLKNVYKSYANLEDSLAFWKSFESIYYNAEQDRFEFTYDLNAIKTIKQNKKRALTRTRWTVCSCVWRSIYNRESKVHDLYFVTDKMKSILDKYGIDYTRNPDIKQCLLNKKEVSLHKDGVFIFNQILNLRVTDSSKDSGSSENDFIHSPVEPFFDSRKSGEKLPENGDANGAYNIARKGICLLQNISKSEDAKKAELYISDEQWQNYVQADTVAQIQRENLES